MKVNRLIKQKIKAIESVSYSELKSRVSTTETDTIIIKSGKELALKQIIFGIPKYNCLS